MSGVGGRTRSVLRGAGIILVITIAARIAGFVRYLVFGGSVGAGDVGTAYASANLVPTVLFEIVAGGALAAVVVPLVAGLVPEQTDGPTERRDGPAAQTDEPCASTDERDEEPTGSAVPAAAIAVPPVPPEASAQPGAADQVISALLGWLLLVTVPLAAVVALLAEPIAELVLGAGPSASHAVTGLGAQLLRVFAPQLPLYGIAVVLAAYLQARKRFTWPALMPLLSSLVVMASYRVYAAMVPTVATASTISDQAVAWLGWGTTAGVAAMALPVLVVSLRAGLRLRPTLQMPSGMARRALGLAAAGLGAVAAQQGVMALILVLAMRAGGTGTLPVFQYAQALYLLPYAILVVPLMTSVFPHLAELRLVGDTIGFARMAAASVRTVIAVASLGAAMLFAAGPGLEQFFRQIDRAGAAGVGAATAALALGLAGYAVTMQCSRVLAAALRSRDALVVGSVGWVVAGLLVLAVGLPAPERSAGEAATAFGLSVAVGMLVGAAVGIARITDLLEAADAVSALRRTATGAVLAMLVGGICGLLVTRVFITTVTPLPAAVLAGAGGGVLAGALTLLVLAAVDPVQTRDLLARLRRRAGRV